MLCQINFACRDKLKIFFILFLFFDKPSGSEEQRTGDVKTLPNYGVQCPACHCHCPDSSWLCCFSGCSLQWLWRRNDPSNAQSSGSWCLLSDKTSSLHSLPPLWVSNVGFMKVQNKLTEVKGVGHLSFLESIHMKFIPWESTESASAQLGPLPLAEKLQAACLLAPAHRDQKSRPSAGTALCWALGFHGWGSMGKNGCALKAHTLNQSQDRCCFSELSLWVLTLWSHKNKQVVRNVNLHELHGDPTPVGLQSLAPGAGPALVCTHTALHQDSFSWSFFTSFPALLSAIDRDSLLTYTGGRLYALTLSVLLSAYGKCYPWDKSQRLSSHGADSFHTHR